MGFCFYHAHSAASLIITHHTTKHQTLNITNPTSNITQPTSQSNIQQHSTLHTQSHTFTFTQVETLNITHSTSHAQQHTIQQHRLKTHIELFSLRAAAFSLTLNIQRPPKSTIINLIDNNGTETLTYYGNGTWLIFFPLTARATGKSQLPTQDSRRNKKQTVQSTKSQLAAQTMKYISIQQANCDKAVAPWIGNIKSRTDEKLHRTCGPPSWQRSNFKELLLTSLAPSLPRNPQVG